MRAFPGANQGQVTEAIWTLGDEVQREGDAGRRRSIFRQLVKGHLEPALVFLRERVIEWSTSLEALTQRLQELEARLAILDALKTPGRTPPEDDLERLVAELRKFEGGVQAIMRLREGEERLARELLEEQRRQTQHALRQARWSLELVQRSIAVLEGRGEERLTDVPQAPLAPQPPPSPPGEQLGGDGDSMDTGVGAPVQVVPAVPVVYPGSGDSGDASIRVIEPEMVEIPAGSFRMGSPWNEPERRSDEGPQRMVHIRRFAIGRTEVTFREYDLFARATGRELPSDRGWGRGRRPVINVSWNDAVAYAEWLSQQTGENYRLPTEAEWEYAARAGTDTPFWTGDCINTHQANYHGNYDYNNCGADTGVYRGQTVETGSLPANPWGLHETAGNVWEWVQDCWHENYEGAPTDGSAWEKSGCARRVVRGGGWDGRPAWVRSSARNRGRAHVANIYAGFRLARVF